MKTHGKPKPVEARSRGGRTSSRATYLRDLEARILECVADAIIAVDRQGRVIYWNKAAESLYGWPAEEVLGRSIIELSAPPTSHEQARKIIALVHRGGTWSGEFPLLRRDGSQFQAAVVDAPLRDAAGKVVGIIGSGRDVSQRRRLEAKLKADLAEKKLAREQLVDSEAQLRALTRELHHSREEERTRIAREIHDELGQTLTALKIDLHWVESQLGDSRTSKRQEILRRIRSASELTSTTIRSIQAIAADLRPGVLDSLGLVAALEFEARRFHQRTGIRCRVKSSPNIPVLSPAVATALFRICQESLTNVARHAAASIVEVDIKVAGEDVCLSIADNGRGMANLDDATAGSLGLVGIRERAAMLGGTATFSSKKDKGTVVEVRVPQRV